MPCPDAYTEDFVHQLFISNEISSICIAWFKDSMSDDWNDDDVFAAVFLFKWCVRSATAVRYQKL
jgi:hypothetical protein